MARAGITEAQVFEAADALSRENVPVTVAAVRERIGSGSYSTVTALLAKWKEANDNRKQTPIPDTPDSVEKAFRQIWALAWKEAQDSLKLERDALEAARRDIEHERRELTAEIERLEQELDAERDETSRLTQTLDQTQNALQHAENGLAELKIDHARLSERLAAAEDRHHSDERRLQTAQQETGEARKEAAALADKLTQAGQEREAMLQAHNSRSAELERQLIENQASSKALEKELAGVRKELDTASKAKDKALEQAKQMELDNARLSERVAHAEGRAGDLKEELDKLHSRLQEMTAKKEPKPKEQKE